MIAIREFIQQIISVSIIAIIIELILPKGNTKKYVYTILSLFVLLNIISPVINIIKNDNMQKVFDDVLETISSNTQNNDNISIDEFSEYKNMKIESTVAEELSKEIEIKLEGYNLEFKDLRVSLNDDYSIKNLKITIGNLDDLGDRKIDKISTAISSISRELEIDENAISIIEEGSW